MTKLFKSDQAEINIHLTSLQAHGVYVIISICGYCGEWLGVKNGKGISGLSHRICGECKIKVMKGEI